MNALTPAQAELAGKYLPCAKTYASWAARQHGFDPDGIESDAGLALCRTAARFDPNRGCSFFTLVRHDQRGVTLDALRSKRRRKEVNARGWQLLAAPKPDEPTDPELLDAVRGYVRRLPPRERYVILQRFWRGLPYYKIGAKMGLSKQRVEQLQRRAISILQMRMGVS